MHRNPISNWQYTFISCQKGRQIILKSICLLKFCGKSNNNTRDGSSSGCGSLSPSAFWVDSCTRLHLCLQLQLWLNALTWLGLIEGPKHKSRHISMRLCATWLDCTRTTKSYAAIHAWNMTRCWYTPTASRRSAAWERERKRRQAELLHSKKSYRLQLPTYFCAEQAAFDWRVLSLGILNYLDSYKRK